MKNHKPPIIFCSPRSGSKIFVELIAAQKNISSLGEFFSRQQTINHDENGNFNFSLSLEDSSQSREYKLKLLQDLPREKYLIKIFPDHFNSEIFSYLNNRYHFLCLERRNKLEQIWSLGWARTTGNWGNCSPKELNLKPNSILYQLKWFEEVTIHIRRFQDTLLLLKSYDLYYYEDLEFKRIKPKLGASKKLPYPIEKSLLFKNRNEVIEWYEEWMKVF